MELELERTQLNGFENVLDTMVYHEETLEMIVPDACPDILRIVDTEGNVCLKGKEAQEGRAEISGTVRAAVLYLPDGAEGLRRLEVTIPFTCSADGAGITGACALVALPQVQAAETRSLNPRKVLVRVNLAVGLQVFAPMTENLCGGVTTYLPRPEWSSWWSSRILILQYLYRKNPLHFRTISQSRQAGPRRRSF